MRGGLTKCYAAARATLGAMGYELEIRKRLGSRLRDESHELNINVACGRNTIRGFHSLDIYTPHYYKSKAHFLESRVEYDLRDDALPYGDGAVDNIYVSHAIEHVEDHAVDRFLRESHRVLREGGVLRIACPDARFLFAVSQFDNDYWAWRISSLSNASRYSTDWDKCSSADFLLRELATPRMRFYKGRIEEKVVQPEDVHGLEYSEFTAKLRAGLQFRKDYPGDHINCWDYERLRCHGERAGFEHILESKYRGSVSGAMRGAEFDRTHPQMSLYVDMVR